ncbi:asparagine synthetase A [Oxyplasma meridianum]|uniref:Asparagine synthetase A n=1 Tax=Oxyplasma meridianum TaxID=3073602 RepID=A0AAX4NFM6_9ARCH
MEIEKVLDAKMDHVKSDKVIAAVKIGSDLRYYLGKFMREQGYVEVPPVIISPLTDPLNHPVFDPVINYYGEKYSLTKSMIFHKQIMVQSFGSIFTFSPNIRIEEAERSSTGRHLSEFTQLDVEKRGATRDEIMSMVEEMITGLFRYIREKDSELLSKLGRNLQVPSKPFERIKFLDAEKQYGKDFETVLSKKKTEPFWIVDIPLQQREFYDRESDTDPEILVDMDLVYPEGFGEAISGGEREFKLDKIKERISKKGQTEEQFKWFVEFARRGLEPSAGFGIGIERLTRFICGFKRIEDTHPFPKVPGEFSL